MITLRENIIKTMKKFLVEVEEELSLLKDKKVYCNFEENNIKNEDIIKYEYRKNELEMCKSDIERYVKKLEFLEKVDKKYENFFWSSEE